MPEFEMPKCWRHFWKGHRWWCRACDREAERQFKQLAEAWWGSVDVVTELTKLNNFLMTVVKDSPSVKIESDPRYRDGLYGGLN